MLNVIDQLRINTSHFTSIHSYGAFTIKKANNHNKLLHNHHTSHFIGYNAQQDGGNIGSTDSAILNSVYSRSL